MVFVSYCLHQNPKTMKTQKTILIAILLTAIVSSVAYAGTDAPSVAQQNNNFAFNLYRNIAVKETGNIFISPFSISTALAMTYAGASGSTAEEMASVMHFGPNAEAFHSSYGSYLAHLKKNAEGHIDWRVANRLFGEKKYIFLQSFLDMVSKAYASPLEKMNFLTAAEESRKIINAWVEKNTENRIQNLIPEGAISSDTRLVLANAVYFKADWLYKFKKEDTKDANFTKPDKSKKKVPFMNYTGAFHYTATALYQGIRLPYKGEKHSMIIILPTETPQLPEVEKGMASSSFDAFYYEYMPQVKVSIPKFKTTLGLSLSEILKNMGMKRAFVQGADFSKMSKDNNLCISEVFHKAFIEVDEKGTEAAAATAVVMMVTSSGPSSKPQIIEFTANKPFLFYIVDDETKSILFMGRIMEPVNE